VYLVLDRPRWTPYDAHYFPEPDVPMVRISEPKNYRDSADDPAGVTVLCAELPCTVGDTTWTASDADLGAIVADALGRAGLPPVSVADVAVRRIASVYPVYRLGFEEHFAAVDHWASALANVVHFGRQGLFAHDNTHHALAMAWAAADAWSAGALDEGAWARARRGFESHVVED
jgi:protoporphyrinogen oxidase